MCTMLMYLYTWYRRILDDLSSADATLKAAGTDPLALAAAATLQAQQVCLFHTPLQYTLDVHVHVYTLA